VLRTWPALVYLAINTGASAGALGIILGNGGIGQKRWVQVLWLESAPRPSSARLSSRSVQAITMWVSVPPRFLQIFLVAADRQVDRLRAQARSDAVAQIMKDVDYPKAFKALPPYCLALMQNVSPEDQQQLGQALKRLEQDAGEPSVKVRLLGPELINVVGIDVRGVFVPRLPACQSICFRKAECR
jgi:hypothetical protein